jgi:hypothetical protein
MPAPIIIEVTPQAQAVIAKLQRFPQEMGQAIKRGMDNAGVIAQGDITRQRFSGKGPFPPLLHKLGEVSERTKQALIWKPAQVSTAGNQVSVTGTIGVFGVWYFRLHEEGFSKVVHKKKGGSRILNIPARAPLRTGIQDHIPNFQRKIQEELEKTLNAKT